MSDVLGKFSRFIVVGALCAGLFFAVHYVLVAVLKTPLALALLPTYAACFGIGYTLQRSVAFRASSKHRQSLPRYFVLHFAGMIFVYFVTMWAQPLFSLGSFGPSLIATALAGMASFAISMCWVFQDTT